MAGNSQDAPLNEFFTVHYEELRLLAHRRLQRNETITLLDTTALVHESYLRFLKAGRVQMPDRCQFVAFAAHVMRSIIVDYVRRRRADAAAERIGGCRWKQIALPLQGRKTKSFA